MGNLITFLNVGDNMLKTVIEISVIVGTIFLGGCGVSTILYEPYLDDHPVIRVHPVPHSEYYSYNGLFAYAPKPIPRRLYYYDSLWYDEPSTVVIRSNVDRVRVPNSRLTTHFRTAPKRRNVDKEFKEMYRKRNEKPLNKRRTPDESTRIKRDPKRTKGVSRRNQQRRGSRPKQRPSSGNDSGKDSNRVRVHDGDSGKRRRPNNPRQR